MSYQDMFEAALKAEGVSGPLADLARSINKQESGGGKNTKTSNAGAEGGMQIIPSTFASVADKGWDIKNPEHNARAGIRYIQQLNKQAGGDPALTAAGYYGGPGGLEKARKGIAVSDPRNPNAPTTLQYGQQVVARMGKAPTNNPSPLAMPDAQFAQLPVQAPVVVPENPVVAAPVLPPPEVVAQAMAVPPVAVAPDPWAAMKMAEAQQITPADMNYGGMPAPVQVAQDKGGPNFSSFLKPLRRMIG